MSEMPLEDIPDDELPGMWSRVDFIDDKAEFEEDEKAHESFQV